MVLLHAELGTPFGGFTLSAFGEDGFGNLYVMGLDGNVYQFTAAVPEPATWASLAAGLGMLSVWRRRAFSASLRRAPA